MIHTSIWASGQVAKLSYQARLLFIGLITFADDDGRLKGNPSLLRSQIFPYDEEVSVKNVENWLKEVLDQNLVLSYVINDEQYLYHPNWSEYQTLRNDRRKESHIPSPDGNQVSTKSPHKISKDKVREGKVRTLELFEKFYKEYPNKKGKEKAKMKWIVLSPDDNLFNDIMLALEKVKKSEQWTKDDGKFIPHPATWLYQKRWEDEVEVPTIKKVKKF